MQRVLVTGANGFVGRRVCQRLLDSGYAVAGTIRRAASAAVLPAGVRCHEIGDIATFAAWPRVLADVDAVVHLVARTHVMKEQVEDPLPLFRQVNVEGTRRLFEACSASPVQRFVFISSIKAMGESTEQAYTEDMPCRPEDAYGISKRESEHVVFEQAAKLEIEPVVLRPPLIYGPGVLGNFRRMLAAVDRGIPLPLSQIENRRSLLFVDNFASAIEVCLRHPQAAHQVFHVADAESVSTTELIRRMAAAFGKRPRLLPVPVGVLQAAGRLTRKQAQVTRLVSSLTVSTEKLERLTGWTPAVTLGEGLATTVRHFQPASKLPAA